MGPLGFEPRTDGLKVTSSRFILAILALPLTQEGEVPLEGEIQLYLISLTKLLHTCEHTFYSLKCLQYALQSHDVS